MRYCFQLSTRSWGNWKQQQYTRIYSLVLEWLVGLLKGHTNRSQTLPNKHHREQDNTWRQFQRSYDINQWHSPSDSADDELCPDSRALKNKIGKWINELTNQKNALILHWNCSKHNIGLNSLAWKLAGEEKVLNSV